MIFTRSWRTYEEETLDIIKNLNTYKTEFIQEMSKKELPEIKIGKKKLFYPKILQPSPERTPKIIGLISNNHSFSFPLFLKYALKRKLCLSASKFSFNNLLDSLIFVIVVSIFLTRLGSFER